MAALRFTREHEWIRVEGDVGTVGITDYAQQQLGDIVFVELPEIGAAVGKGTQAAVVESVKAASEVYAPASGEVIAVNEALAGDPGIINRSPESEGWLVRVRVADPAETGKLMDGAEYKEYLRETS